MDNIAHHIDDISQYRTGSGHLSGAPSHEHGIVASLTMNKYGIEGISDCGKRMAVRDQCGMYFYFNSFTGKLCNTKQFDHIAEFFCIPYILRSDLRDTFRINLRKRHAGTKSDGCHNGDLASRIIAFHIRCGICLRIPQSHSHIQSFLIAHPFLRHFGQNIVGGTIDDSHDLRQLTSRQALPQRADNGNGACYCRLEL